MMKDLYFILTLTVNGLASYRNNPRLRSAKVVFTLENFHAYRNQHYQRGTVTPIQNPVRGSCTGMCINWLNNTLTISEEQIQLTTPDHIVSNVIQRHLMGNATARIGAIPGLVTNPFYSTHEKKLGIHNKIMQNQFFNQRIGELKNLGFNLRFLRQWRIVKEYKTSMIQHNFFPLAQYLFQSNPQRLLLYNGTHVNAIWVTQTHIYYLEPCAGLFSITKQVTEPYACEFLVACLYSFHYSCQTAPNYDDFWSLYEFYF